MSRRHPLSDEDHALWTGFVRSIKPLRRVQRLAEPLAGEKPVSQPLPAAPRPAARLETLPEKKPPAARAARSAAKATCRARPRSHRCASRSARLYADGGPCRIVPLPAARASKRRQDRARRNRQGNGPGIGPARTRRAQAAGSDVAVAAAIPIAGRRIRGRASRPWRRRRAVCPAAASALGFRN